jgi:hypothetical protein
MSSPSVASCWSLAVSAHVHAFDRKKLEHVSVSGVGPSISRRQRKENVMLKLRLAAGLLAVGFTGLPALAQQSQPPTAQVQSELIGLAVYSSDGEKLGRVTQVGTAEGKPAVRAELGGFLDVAPSLVVIPVGLFEQKPDRIELAMTAVEVEDTLSRQQQQ